LNKSRPSTEATCLAVAALKTLNALPLNQTSLRLWLLAAQNADGGFPFSLGIRSDTLSTFYAVQALALIGKEPFSPISLNPAEKIITPLTAFFKIYFSLKFFNFKFGGILLAIF
jgi:prenyltransferase beta subunit